MIVGLGGVGMAALITAISQSVSRIVAVDTLDEKLAHARRLGAHETYTPQEVAERASRPSTSLNAPEMPEPLRRRSPRPKRAGRRSPLGYPIRMRELKYPR